MSNKRYYIENGVFYYNFRNADARTAVVFETDELLIAGGAPETDDDLSGRLVAKETFAAPGGASEHTLDASDLNACVYVYGIRAADGRKAEGKLMLK